MNSTDTNTTEIRMLSDEDLAAVAGGFVTYTGGGGGTMAHGKVQGSRPNGSDILVGFLITAGTLLAIF
jgi:hypothetical protein